MDDGHRTFYNQTVLNTNSFSYSEILLLQEALMNNFSLRTRTTEKRPGQYLIYIPVKQMVPLKTIVGDYLVQSMQYKIKELCCYYFHFIIPKNSQDNTLFRFV